MSNLISISEAASRTGRKPFEVVRLIDAGLLRHVVLVDETSLADIEGESS